MRRNSNPVVSLAVGIAVLAAMVTGAALCAPGRAAGEPAAPVPVLPTAMQEPKPEPPARGAVWAVYADGTREPVEGPLDGSYATWRASTPRLIVTRGDIYAELVFGHHWQHDEALTLATAAVTCEAPAYDRIMTVDGWRPDGRVLLGAGLLHEGDHGLALGWAQVRSDVHVERLTRLDPFTIEGGAALATEIRAEAIRIGWRPLQPWTCAP